MLDQFLTTILHVVIVVDILGVIAYFVVGGLRTSPQQEIKPRRTLSVLGWLPWRRPQVVPATESEFSKLKRVLYSYKEGLAYSPQT